MLIILSSLRSPLSLLEFLIRVIPKLHCCIFRPLKWLTMAQKQIIGMVFKDTLNFVSRLNFLSTITNILQSLRFFLLTTVSIGLMWKQNLHIVYILLFTNRITSFVHSLLCIWWQKYRLWPKFSFEPLGDASSGHHNVPFHGGHFFIGVFSIWGLGVGISHSDFLIFFTKLVIFA